MKKFIFIAVLSLYAVCAQAQQGGFALTFEEAFNKTLTGNPALTAAGYEESAATEERKAAFGLRLPQIGAMGSYVHLSDDIGVDVNSLKKPVQGALDYIGSSGVQLPPAVLGVAQGLLGKNWGLTIQDRDFAFIGGTVSLPVYTGGKINAANRAARLSQQAAVEKGYQTRNALVSELVERYYGLRLASQAVKVREQVNEAMKMHLRDARAMEENGIIARSERLYMEVKAAEAERDLLAAKLQEETLRDALNNTLNEQGEFEPVSLMFILNSMQSVSYFKDMAARNNPQLKQVSLTKSRAQEGVKVQRAEYFPQIAAMGGMNFYDYQVSKSIPKWFVGAGIKINIFDGLTREHKYRAAKYTVNQVEAIEYKAANDIALLIGKLYNEMSHFRDRMPSLSTSLQFAEEYLRVQNTAFRDGIASATDVIDAELNLASTHIDRLQTAYYYDLMLARLLEAAGISEQFPAYAASAEAEFIKYE